MSDLTVIGRAERIDLVTLDLESIPAKVDTGADTSSIWASYIRETNEGLEVVLFGPGSQYYTGKPVIIAKNYRVTRIANSFGQRELRYKVKVLVRVKDRLIRATFTLSDRSLKTYPVLLGRRLLQGKFVVDVAAGEPLRTEEKARQRRLRLDLGETNDRLEAEL